MNTKISTRLISALLSVIMLASVMPTSLFSPSVSAGQITDGTADDINPSVISDGDTDASEPDHTGSTTDPVLPEELNQTFETTVGDVLMTEDGFRIQMNSDLKSYCILSYIGSAKDVKIPESYNDIPITRIGDSAFFRKGVKTVTLSENIVSMGIDVFFECENLTYTRYEGGKYIGSADNPYYYFVGPEDSTLTEITLHADTRIIAVYALRACYQLQRVTVPGDRIIQMGYGMVLDCPALESLTIPYVGEKKDNTRNAHFGYIFGSRTYGGNVSYVTESLRSLTINGGSIGQSAFYGVDMLESITVPEVAGGYFSYMFGGTSADDNIVPTSIKQVTVLGGEIKEKAFYKCVGVESVTLCDGVTGIGASAFYGCTRLASVTIGNGVTSIGDYAFYSCGRLTDVTIPDGVTSIGDYAFYSCGLTDVTIPDGVTSIGYEAFLGCSSLTSIQIPDSVTSIDAYAFYNCIKLASVTIGNDVTSIGNSAFYGCTSLTSITIPDSVTSIGYQAFGNCIKLASVTIGSGVTSIDSQVLSDCSSLASITVATNNPIYHAEGNCLIETASKALILGCKNSVIPNDGSVTSIGNSAFYGCTSLTSITIPDSVTSIGYQAFYNCSKLASVTIGNGVTSIGNSAFYGCKSLTSITIPDGVTSIGYQTFYNCSNLASVTIGNDVTSIGNSAFYGCTSLTSITIPDSVTSIGSYAFCKCSSLTSITIPDGVTSIGNSTFNNCSSLTSIEIPNGVTSIGSYAFCKCSSLTSITIPDGVTSIGNSTFNNCSSLTSIEIPNGVTSIGNDAFNNCSSLTSIEIPNSVTSIGDYAFCKCSSLTSITIPDSVTSIGSYAFSGCSQLTIYCVADSQPSGWKSNWNLNKRPVVWGYQADVASASISDSAHDESVALLRAESKKTSTVLLHEDTISQSMAVKSECTAPINEIALLSADDSDSVGSAGLSYTLNSDGASYSVSNGTCTDRDIVIPATYNGKPVTYIGFQAFRNRSSLTSIEIPGGVTSIGYEAFLGCSSLTSIQIPDSVTSIDAYAFSGCSSLASVTIGNDVTSIGNYAFSNTAYYKDSANWENDVLYIGKHLIASNSIAGAYSIRQGTKCIAGMAFYNCSSLTSITIPDSVMGIGGWAFYGCSSLAGSITIPDGVTSIGTATFYNCSSLTSITIPDSVTSIGYSAFYNCSSLTSITVPFVGAEKNATSNTHFGYIFGASSYSDNAKCVPKSLKTVVLTGGSSIGNHAFTGCSSLTSIKIPDGVTSICEYAFSSCSNLTSIKIPDGVTSICEYAFLGCSSLTSITIPASVTSIGEYAFCSCTALQEAVINSIGTMGAYAFFGCTALTSVTISGIRRLNSYVFHYCTALTDIYYNGERNEWRHIVKAGDWDAGAGAYTVHFLRPDSGLLYETDNTLENFYLSGHTGTNGNAVVPELYSGRSVVALLPRAFYGNVTLVTLKLPETITYIGDSAFKNCINLTEVNIPAGVSTLAFGIFSGCESLAELEDVPITEDQYFGYFFGAYSYKESESALPTSFRSVSVRAGSTISAHTFAYCVHIENIELPDGLQTIGAYAFEKCRQLTSVTIPAGIKEINEYTFTGCSSLPDVKLPEGITSIGAYAFEDCISLKNGTILPQTVVTIGDRAFSGCSALTSFEIPDSVTTVGEMILDGCNYIRTVKLGRGLRLENIADYTEGKSIANGTHVNGNPFLGIDKSRSLLEKYEVAEDHPQFAVDSYGVLYYQLAIGTDSVSVAVIDAPAMANLVGYAFPDHIVEICPYAFAYNTTVTSIDLEYVRLIGNHAFYEATGLVYVKLSEPENEDAAFDAAITQDQNKRQYSQYIRSSAFMGCTALQSATIGSPMLVGIEELAFADCPLLKTVVLGENIQVLGLRAFGTTGKVVSGLERFIVDEANPYFKSIDGVLYRYRSDSTLTLVTYPALTPVMINGEIQYKNGKAVRREEFSVPDGVSAIESYAFETARELHTLTVAPNNDITVGDYAFANSALRHVTLGANVISVGLKRGEGEYTVFSGCSYLTAIDVKSGNRYYCSKSGVLFNQDRSVLIKYPAAKAGTVYTLPNTVSAIASMAFKDNDSLACVVITSAVSVIGLEAFYDCSTLSLIYFDHVYAPTVIMENAFTTYVSVDDTDGAASQNPRTQIGYHASYYENGENTGIGWKKYENTYPLVQYDSLPDFTVQKNGGYYAVVVVDSEGTRLGSVRVSLTDPNGTTETVEAIGGVATFTDLFGKTGLGFTVDYDRPYSIRVFDEIGEYFTYTNPAFYLDQDMRITYVTLTKSPSAYGVNCGTTDINSQTAEINQSEYDYVYESVTLIDESKGYVEDNLQYNGKVSETVEVSVIGYCDEKSGWSFDASKCALYQNGKQICGVSRTEKQDDGALLLFFALPVMELAPETAIEARLTAVKEGETDATCATALNIHVFEFSITADDVEINDETLSADLQNGGDIFTKLFGSGKLNVNIGKNVSVTAQTDGSEITLNFSAKTSKKKTTSHGSYKKGYENVAGSRAHNKNTYFFTFDTTVTDSNNVKHHLIYNIRFARDWETEGYFYYRCYIYEGTRGVDYGKEVQTFYGAVNSQKAVTQGRSGLAAKAWLIYGVHMASAKHAKDMDKIKKLGTDAQYSEALRSTAHIENSHTFEASLNGDFVFKYDRENGIQPVSGYIKGELSYTFKHNSQFVVWVIPVVLEIEVKLDGKIELNLKADNERRIYFENIKMTLSADIAAQIGVGCSVASVGLYGSVGTVFVLDFYPTWGVESWKLNGEIGAYVKVLWYTKKFTFGKWENVDLLAAVQQQSQVQSMSAAYLVDGYTLSDPDEISEDPRLVIVGEEIYKICMINAAGVDASRYDTYNCYKLAIAKWNKTESEWETLGMVDDNGLNDMSYSVIATENALEILFTQQTERLSAENADDVYASVEKTVLKRAVLTNDSASITVDTVYQGQSYPYLVQNAIIDGVPVAIWVENSDNNMFGVSPRNYIDANGDSHVFETTANAIWMSRLENGKWTDPQCVQSGLSAVTGMVMDANGGIAYIVDENGDLADTEDRVLYYIDPNGEEVCAVNDPEEGSVVNLIQHADGIAYYYQSKNGTSGLCVFDGTTANSGSAIIENSGLTEAFRYVYDTDGSPLGIIYAQNKTWRAEDDSACDGSAFYGMFYEDGKWGEPVELGAYEPENGVYISHFDCLSNEDGKEILLSFDLSDSDGNTVGNRTIRYSIAAELVVDGMEIDYEEQTVTLTLVNRGAKKTAAYLSVDEELPEKVAKCVMSGETLRCVYSLAQYESLTHGIAVSDEEGNTVWETEVDLTYSDLVPYVKQLLLGQQNYILVAVTNNGNLTNRAAVVIRKGNYGDANLSIANLDAIAQGLGDTAGKAVPVKLSDDEDAETVWISNVSVEPGETVYLEVPMEGSVLNDNCLVSVSAKPENADLEKGSAAENNLAYWSYKSGTGVASTLDGSVLSEIPTEVGISQKKYSFDSQLPSNIVISFHCPAAYAVAGIQDALGNALPASAYTVDAETSEITLTEEYLNTLGYGTHEFEIVFTEDVRVTFAVEVRTYYTVLWRNEDGTEIEKNTAVAERSVPTCSVVPEKESDAEIQYVFAGWDVDGDGKADAIPAAQGDMTLTAVYTEVLRKYSVTWILKIACDTTFRVTEEYSYGDIPEYLGSLPAPENEVFASWDKEPVPVTEDTVYEACYTKIALGSATLSGTSFRTAPGLQFQTTLSLSEVSGMTETVLTLCMDADVAEMVSYTCRDGVSVLSEENGKLTLAVKNLAADAQIPLIDLCFQTSETALVGSHTLISVETQDSVQISIPTVDIYQMGDVSGDGKINTRDVAILQQYVVGKRELSDAQLYYANYYVDYDSDGKPKINTRDVALLQQYIVGKIQ